MSDTLSDNIINAIKTFDWLRVLRMIRETWEYCFDVCQLNWYSRKLEKEVFDRWLEPLLVFKKDQKFSFDVSLEDFSKYLIGEDVLLEKTWFICLTFITSLAAIMIIPLLCSTLGHFFYPKVTSSKKRSVYIDFILGPTLIYVFMVLPFKSSDAMKAIRVYAMQFLSFFFSFKYIVGIDELIFISFVALTTSAFYICKRASGKSEICKKIAASMHFLTDSCYNLVATVYIAFLINKGILMSGENDVISTMCILLPIVTLLILFNLKRSRIICTRIFNNLISDLRIFLGLVLAVICTLNDIIFFITRINLHDSFLGSIVLFLIGVLAYLFKDPLRAAILVIGYRVIKTLFFENQVNQENENGNYSTSRKFTSAKEQENNKNEQKRLSDDDNFLRYNYLTDEAKSLNGQPMEQLKAEETTENVETYGEEDINTKENEEDIITEEHLKDNSMEIREEAEDSMDVNKEQEGLNDEKQEPEAA